jgi:hypothetical protein
VPFAQLGVPARVVRQLAAAGISLASRIQREVSACSASWCCIWEWGG